MTEMRTATPQTSAPWHLWVVGTIALLFNAIGAVDYTMSMTQEMNPLLTTFYRDLPFWMKVAWPLGAWSALAGSVLILLRKKLAAPVFAVSFAAFLLNMLYTYVLNNIGEVMGPTMGVKSVVVAGLFVFFLWYVRMMTRRGVMG